MRQVCMIMHRYLLRERAHLPLAPGGIVAGQGADMRRLPESALVGLLEADASVRPEASCAARCSPGGAGMPPSRGTGCILLSSRQYVTAGAGTCHHPPWGEELSSLLGLRLRAHRVLADAEHQRRQHRVCYAVGHRSRCRPSPMRTHASATRFNPAGAVDGDGNRRNVRAKSDFELPSKSVTIPYSWMRR